MWANNAALENQISIQSAKKQLAAAPSQTGKSIGYPHIYENRNKFFHQPEGTTFMEYPIFGVETVKKKLRIYNYCSKPKDRPSPFRAIATSTDKTYIGIISHDGMPGNPAMANFHCVHKAEGPEELEDEELEEGEVEEEVPEELDDEELEEREVEEEEPVAKAVDKDATQSTQHRLT